MKAIVYCEHGSPDLLELEDNDKPPVKPPSRPIPMRGVAYISRLQAGLRRPKDSAFASSAAARPLLFVWDQLLCRLSRATVPRWG